MPREIIESSLKSEVFANYDDKCYVCGYSLKAVLRVHHIVPVSLGGADNLDNLILLCGNCHTLTHFYSSKKYQNKEIKSLLGEELSDESQEKLKKLIGKIHLVKKEIEKAGNLWTINGEVIQAAYKIDEAVEKIVKRNKFTNKRKELFVNVLQLVLQNIPDNVFEKCSYRLLDKGRCISINLMNYLIFRSPAYGDLGGKPNFDCYIIFPNNIHTVQFIKNIESRVGFRFAYFDCVNLELSYDEILVLEAMHWSLFKEACHMALNARKTREWTSNIRVARTRT